MKVKRFSYSLPPERIALEPVSPRDRAKLLVVGENLRDKMNVKSDAEFIALRDGFRDGIPSGDPVDDAAADRFLQLMAELGGEKLVGKATSLPEGLFVHVD